MTKVKICGLKRKDDIQWANILMPDYIGFIFAKKSKRYITPYIASELKRQLNPEIKAVGVFVNAPINLIDEISSSNIIDMIQLHGNEDNRYINELRNVSDKTLIQAFCVSPKKDILNASKSCADIILLDNGNGGTGVAFDWSYIQNIERPFILAGGITPQNVTCAVRKFKPFAVDTSSGVELNGVKSFDKMKDFITNVRSIV